MSCYASLNGVCFCEATKEKCAVHNMDVAIDIINEDKLRICCLNCDKEIEIDITDEQFELLNNFWRQK